MSKENVTPEVPGLSMSDRQMAMLNRLESIRVRIIGLRKTTLVSRTHNLGPRKGDNELFNDSIPTPGNSAKVSTFLGLVEDQIEAIELNLSILTEAVETWGYMFEFPEPVEVEIKKDQTNDGNTPHWLHQ